MAESSSFFSKVWKAILNIVPDSVESIVSSLWRNAFIFLLIYGVFSFGHLSNRPAYMDTINFLVCLECLALFLSNIAVIVYTNTDFVRARSSSSQGEGFEHDSRALGYIFLGVHVMCGLAVIGIHFTNFT